MPPQITLITKRGADATLSKRTSLDDAGGLRPDGSQCRMAEGVTNRRSTMSHEVSP
jgi:hypothetical protein